MTDKLQQITRELKEFFDAEFHTDFFTIIYGSYAYGVNTSDSDLDLVTISRQVTQDNRTNTLDFLFDMYTRYGLAVDDEVPHERKLLADYQTLDDAINGSGFERKDGRMYVPPVVKTKEFLHSNEIVMRLLVNALTGKNILVTGDREYYADRRKRAVENMIGFMFSIEGVESFTIPDFVRSLIGTPERHGEMYLGYKDMPAVRAYLAETFGAAFLGLIQTGILTHDTTAGIFHVRNPSWLSKVVG